jgi:uncharacterized protein YqjF (DUF2071 family)
VRKSADLPPPFLTAEWRELVMLSWSVDARVLAPLVPAGTELDAWNGTTYASLVGFRFLRTRVLGIPIPFHRDFDEVNLRFYVRRRGASGEMRRGVVFVRELVPRIAIATVARVVYDEPYLSVPMRHSLTLPASSAGHGHVRYEWRYASAWHAMQATITGEPTMAPEDSLDAFITEHYWGYTRRRSGRTSEYHVSHPRWTLWAASAPVIDGDLERLYGAEYARAFDRAPDSTLVATGSAVTVHRGRPIA